MDLTFGLIAVAGLLLVELVLYRQTVRAEFIRRAALPRDLMAIAHDGALRH